MQVERLQQMFGRITRAEMAPFTADVSPECRDLVLRLLDPNPCARYSVSDALCHLWVVEDLDHELQARRIRRCFCWSEAHLVVELVCCLC